LTDPKKRIICVYKDESKEMCNKVLKEIVETQPTISIIRLFTDDKREFHVCHYQKCPKECSKEYKEEKPLI